MRFLVGILSLVALAGFSWFGSLHLHEGVSARLAERAERELAKYDIQGITVHYDHLDAIVSGAQTPERQQEIREIFEAHLPSSRLVFSDWTFPYFTDLTYPDSTTPPHGAPNAIDIYAQALIDSEASIDDVPVDGTDLAYLDPAFSSEETSYHTEADNNPTTLLSQANAKELDRELDASQHDETMSPEDLVDLALRSARENNATGVAYENAGRVIGLLADDRSKRETTVTGLEQHTPTGDGSNSEELASPATTTLPEHTTEKEPTLPQHTAANNSSDGADASPETHTVDAVVQIDGEEPAAESASVDVSAAKLAMSSPAETFPTAQSTADLTEASIRTDPKPDLTAPARASTSDQPADTREQEALATSIATPSGSDAPVPKKQAARSAAVASAPRTDKSAEPARQVANPVSIDGTSVPVVSASIEGDSDKLAQKTRVKAKARLGVYMTNNPNDSIVRIVDAGSSADESGIRVGDRIVQIGATSVTEFQDVADAMGKQFAGDVVRIRFERNGSTYVVDTPLQAQQPKD